MAGGGGWLSRRIGAVMPAARNSSPSSTSATASQLAPPSRAARATSIAPWPYPPALTTAHSRAGATAPASTRALCRMASRSISAQARRRSRAATVARCPEPGGVSPDATDGSGSLNSLVRSDEPPGRPRRQPTRRPARPVLAPQPRRPRQLRNQPARRPTAGYQSRTTRFSYNRSLSRRGSTRVVPGPTNRSPIPVIRGSPPRAASVAPINRGPNPTGSGPDHGHRTTSDSQAESRSGRSPATRPSLGPSPAARPWQ